MSPRSRFRDQAGTQSCRAAEQSALKRSHTCTKTGKCADCLAPDCICNQILVTRRNSGAPGRIRVILIGETLGY